MAIGQYAVVVTVPGVYIEHTGLPIECVVGQVINNILVDPVQYPAEQGLSYMPWTDVLNADYTDTTYQIYPKTIPTMTGSTVKVAV